MTFSEVQLLAIERIKAHCQEKIAQECKDYDRHGNEEYLAHQITRYNAAIDVLDEAAFGL